MQALTHSHLPASHIHSLILSTPRIMELPNSSTHFQTPSSPSNSSNSARSSPIQNETLNARKRSRARAESGQEPSSSSRSRIVSAASLTEEMLKREKLEQSLREKTINREEDREPVGIQKQHATCKVCGDAAFGKHYGIFSCNGCKSYFRRSVWFNRQYICRYEGNCNIEKGCRNACRACRLKACFVAGMNPRAVQSERERIGTNKDRSTESVDIASQTEINNSIMWQQFLDVELTKKAQHLLSVHVNAINKTDGDQYSSRISTNEYHEISFTNAFFDPQQVYMRTQLTPNPLRRAVSDDLIEDYMRCFVLFSDWLVQLDEFKLFKYQDQIILAQNRYCLFHWWIVSLWTADSNIDGICYSNGAYFERGSTIGQSGPQLQLLIFLMEKMLDSVVKEIRVLQMTDVERMCLFVIALFSDVENIGLSANGVELAGTFRDLYVRVLYNHILQRNVQVVSEQSNMMQALVRKQSDASLRSSKILLLTCSLKTIVSQSPNEGRLDDQIISRVIAPSISSDLKSL